MYYKQYNNYYICIVKNTVWKGCLKFLKEE